MPGAVILLYIATTLSFTYIASTKLNRIFARTARLSKTHSGQKIFAFLSSITTHPLKWLLTGKTLQETGEYYNITTLTTLGNAIAVPPAFVISTKFGKIPLISKGLQGFLITIRPWNNTYSVITTHTTPTQFLESLNKAKLWFIRDGVEIGLGKISTFSTINKGVALLVTERSTVKTSKVLLREQYESAMRKTWKDQCHSLDEQTPYLISNLLYAVSIDPLFTSLQNLEGTAFDLLHNTTQSVLSEFDYLF
jgi:hypothetical protein